MTAGERDAAVDFIRALVNAWDCCGTCAGGVLAKRDRERDAALVAQAKRDAVGPVVALADEPVAPYPAECHCPHGMGFQFHSFPCRYARDVPKSAIRAALGEQP